MQDAGDESRSEEAAPLPPLPTEGRILPLFNTVIYPQTVTPLAISQPGAVQLIDLALQGGELLTLVALHTKVGPPGPVDPSACYTVGTVAIVHRLLRLPDNTLRVAAEGVERVRIEAFTTSDSHMWGRFAIWPDRPSDAAVVAQLLARTIAQARVLARFLPILTDDLQIALAQEESPQRISYLLAMNIAAHCPIGERQALLELDSVEARLERLCVVIDNELQRARRHHAGAAFDGLEGSPTTLQRRPELWELPLVQEARALGRIEGMRSMIVTLLRDRFSDDPGRAAVEAHIETLHEHVALERLLFLVGRTAQLEDIRF